jgi:hypothetical protein
MRHLPMFRRTARAPKKEALIPEASFANSRLLGVAAS